MAHSKIEEQIRELQRLPMDVVGVQRFDDEHIRLMELLQNTTDAVHDHANAVDLRESLSQVFAYAITHFSEEENFMAEIGYPGLPKHRHEHQQIMERLQQQLHRYEHDPWRVALEIVNVLEFWLNEHITNCDVPYGDYLRQN